MSKKNKKAMGKNKASALRASVPAHLANRIVDVKVKKPKKKDWMAFSAQADYAINKALLQAFQDSYAEEKAKADAALAAAFTHVPDPERPVQFVGPRELVEQAKALVQPTKTLFEVQGTRAGNVAEFCKMPDGAFYMGVSGDSWGGCFADITLSTEQFAAFKQWVMED